MATLEERVTNLEQRMLLLISRLKEAQDDIQVLLENLGVSEKRVAMLEYEGEKRERRSR